MIIRASISMVLSLLFFGGPLFAESSSLVFLKNGIPHKELLLKDLKKEQASELLKVFEPHENAQREYLGFSILPLMQNIYGKETLKSYDTLVFYCTDGYRSDIPLMEFQQKKATLSFAMANKDPFVLNKKIQLGPYYLTWDHPDAGSAKKNFFRWPYGINKIDVITSASAYKPLIPLKDNLKTGHQEYLKHCYSCHMLNSVGGMRGPPLNYFVQAKSSEELQKYILNPKAFNKNSQMAGLPVDLAHRQKVAEQIVEYLKKQVEP